MAHHLFPIGSLGNISATLRPKGTCNKNRTRIFQILADFIRVYPPNPPNQRSILVFSQLRGFHL